MRRKGTAKSFMTITLLFAMMSSAFSEGRHIGRSPWGADDEIGRLNLISEQSRNRILSRISGGKTYDLSVDYFIGMPSWQAAGDPHYRIWMTHTPDGTVVDDPLGVGSAMNEHVSYTGAAVSMYTHMGAYSGPFRSLILF